MFEILYKKYDYSGYTFKDTIVTTWKWFGYTFVVWLWMIIKMIVGWNQWESN